MALCLLRCYFLDPGPRMEGVTQRQRADAPRMARAVLMKVPGPTPVTQDQVGNTVACKHTLRLLKSSLLAPEQLNSLQ